MNRTNNPARAAFAIAALAATVAASPAQAAIKAAYVEQVAPGKPFQDSYAAGYQNYPAAIGPGTGTLAVTSITLTNSTTTAQLVYIFAPIMDGAACAGHIAGGSTEHTDVYVQPHQTLHLTYPSPLVFAGINGVTCVGMEVRTAIGSGSVEMDVNGFVN